MITIRSFTTAACAALCVLGLTACTGGDDSKTGKTGKTDKQAAPEEPKQGGDSPEDVYAKVKALYEAETLDTEAFAELWSPPFRKEVSGQMVLMGGFVVDKDKAEPATKALEALIEKHGIKKPEGKVDLTKAKELVGPMMADVSDTVACWKDIMDWLMEYSKDMKERMTNDKPIGDLKDVKTEGEFAMALAKRLKKGKEVEKPMYFRKVDDRWYLDDTSDAKKAFRPAAEKTNK